MRIENIHLNLFHKLATALLISNILYALIHIFSYKYDIGILEMFGNLFKDSIFLSPSYYAMCSAGICQDDVLSLIMLSPIIGFVTGYAWIMLNKSNFIRINNAKIFSNGIFRFQISIIFVIVILNPFLKMTIFGFYNPSRFYEFNFLLQNIFILNIVEISTFVCIISQKLRISK